MVKNFRFTYIYFRKNAFVLAAFALLSVLAFSCTDDDPKPKPSHLRYYPLEIGMWREYTVDSVVWRGSTDYANDTVQFQLREETDSTFTDNTGALNYVFKTFYREKSTDNWTLRYNSAAKISNQRVEKIYNNNRYIKMIFPVIGSQLWDANAYNNEDPDKFKKSKYTEVHKPATINSKSFDSTVTIEIQNHKDVVQLEFETEQYAAGVGLIQHIWEETDTQPNKDIPGKFLIRGHKNYKILTGYGKE